MDSNTPFDPYYTWLGITNTDGPPDHYRLLGIDRFESNRDVIDHAADRQMSHVRKFAAGEHGEESQHLLNELSAARICLLDEEQKGAYDDYLRNHSWPAADIESSVPEAVILVPPSKTKPRKSKPLVPITCGIVVAGCLVVLWIGLAGDVMRPEPDPPFTRSERKLSAKKVDSDLFLQTSDPSPEVTPHQLAKPTEMRRAISTGLVGRYAFDASSGTTVVNEIDAKQVARIHGKAEWVEGCKGNALRINNAFIDFAHFIEFDRAKPFSLSFWIVRHSANNVLLFHCQENTPPVHRGMKIVTLQDSQRLVVQMTHNYRSRNLIWVSSKAPLPLKRWFHLAVTYEGNSKANGIRLYLDGERAGIDARTTQDNLSGTIGTKPLFVGNSNGTESSFTIDELHVYDRSLTPSEVRKLSGKGEPTDPAKPAI